MKQILDIINETADQRSDGWHETRKSRATASEIWKLIPNDSAASGSKDFKSKHEGFGKGAVTYIKRKAMEMYLDRPFVDDLDNVWKINFGKNWESAAIGMVQYIKDIKEIQSSPPFIKYGKNPNIAGGSPDFLSNVLGVGEVKSTNNEYEQAKRWDLVKSIADMKECGDKTVEHGYWQLLANGLFSGIDVLTFVSFCPSYLAGYTDDREYLDFSCGYAFENTSKQNLELGVHIVVGEPNQDDQGIIIDCLDRYEKLRNRFYEELLEKNRKPISLSIS